jgi:hypothetical protein
MIDKGLKMTLKWWEKTVEYKFVMLVASVDKLFLSPLDGSEERAGDAVFSSKNRWLLIEFKRDKSSVADEKKKFNRYEDARSALSSDDNHHHIVFGSLDDAKNLKLLSQTYFSGKGRTLKEMLESGIPLAKFSSYMKAFTAFKKGSETSGGGINMNDLALVAGVGADNNIVECMSLAEFQRQLGLELQQERARTPGQSMER